MLIGAGVRLRIYLANRSMYRDEAALALNIVHRSSLALFKPLDNDQGAPVGFLMVQKLAVSILGNHEYSLRLAPLTASILALPLFWWACRKVLAPGSAVIALAVLAMGAKQYDYAATAKQYSVDVLAAVSLLLVAITATRNPTRRGMIILAIVGAAAIWFSHPAIFVLAGIVAMVLMDGFLALPRARMIDFLAVFAVWAASFAANYLFILRRLSRDDFMQRFWSLAGAFAPIPKSFGALIWYKKEFFEVFEDPCSLGFVGLAALVFVLGVMVLYRRRKSLAFAALLPILIALAASMLHKYPFRERLILFIGPLLAIFIGAGFEYLFEKPRRLVGIIALVFLLITPINTTLDYLLTPPLHSDLRSAVAFAAKNRQPTDVFYVNEFCFYPLEYYQDLFNMGDAIFIRGRQDDEGVAGYKAIFSKFSGKRVWVMFEDAPDAQQSALTALDDLGVRVYEIRPFEDYVACYDIH
jgi:hypothetical protein